MSEEQISNLVSEVIHELFPCGGGGDTYHADFCDICRIMNIKDVSQTITDIITDSELVKNSISTICRKLENEDYNSYIQLLSQQSETAPITYSKFCSLLKDTNRYGDVYIVSFKGVIVASGTIHYTQNFFSSKTAYISNIWVHTHYRKNGFGKMIVSKLIHSAKEKSCNEILVYCSNSSSEKFLIKCGLSKLKDYSTLRLICNTS